MSERACGECHACCKVFDVTELGKSAGVACANLSSTGCAIYAERPRSCSDFQCAWLAGFGADEHRPDRLGLVLDIQHAARGRMFVRATESWPCSSKEPRAQAALAEIASGGAAVIVQRPGGGTLEVLGERKALTALRIIGGQK